MVVLYKFFIKLTSLILLLMTNSVDSTWNDAEGGTIPIPQDKLSLPQISLVKTVFLLLVILWFYGMLPISIAIPLNDLVERRSLEHLESPKERTCKILCELMAAATSEPIQITGQKS
ncbi:uncharacterized protein LOC110838727 [Zootermopsis nevadensis]|uniref:Uncharacterized protein n=1 Tax=Zootermopsis nevadensis TaxID=136037 RepID=A0A067QKN6_ZOONE|nr:uncharacterized protein LOC110838727 [Zootermopsis nevadensis]KDR09462.1 hypothetical protein L798_15669 [Zootermopsis nevadensis]